MKKIYNLILPNSKAPFEEWIKALDKKSKANILAYINRVAYGGGKKNIKPLGDGVFEIKVNYGPGFRVYFAEEGNSIILLLLGGNKKTQSRDIITAKKYWRNHVQE